MASSKSSSIFADIQIAKPIEVFALIADYNKDEFKEKVNLSVGAYRDTDGKPWVLPIVRRVEAQMASDPTLNHEYLPVAGLVDFRKAAIKLLLGEEDSRYGGVQAPGGTGTLRLAAAFTKKFFGCDTVFVSKPTWGNHKGIFSDAGFSNIVEYRYWNAEEKGLDYDGMLEDLRNAPPKSVVILHAVAHNPTGVDPTQDQWEGIAKVCREQDIFVVMDCAYQGFASGNLDTDAWSCRYFKDQGFEFFICQSFSKNFGLYNERVGNLCVVAKDCDAKMKTLSQLELIVRTAWSNPPNHGARIVATVLNSPQAYEQWKNDIHTMSQRILLMRQQLLSKLKAIGCPGTWDHITKQKGMFSYTGLNAQQSDMLLKKYHIYIMKSGRINMCGLTPANIDYVAEAINAVVTESKGQQCKI
ncbi:Golgi Transport [Mactra antiquata]